MPVMSDLPGRPVSVAEPATAPRGRAPVRRPGLRAAGCRVALWAAAAIALAGCGGGLPASVSGRVTLDGQPLTTGLVTFLPVASGPAAYGPVGPDGRYSIQTGGTSGLDPGDYIVTVAANAPPAAAPPPSGGPKYAEPMLLLVTPRRYATKETSPLKATVKPGGQTLDFQLESK